MDEQPNRYGHWLALIWLPVALAIMVPVVVFLALCVYIRAAVVTLAAVVRHLFGYRTPPPDNTPTQPPHVFETKILTHKKQE